MKREMNNKILIHTVLFYSIYKRMLAIHKKYDWHGFACITCKEGRLYVRNLYS